MLIFRAFWQLPLENEGIEMMFKNRGILFFVETCTYILNLKSSYQHFSAKKYTQISKM